MTAQITLNSSSAFLNNGFMWARQQALDWVQTGKGANIPSYWAGLTDRPAFYARDVAHQMLGAHMLGLDRENLCMLRCFAASATAARRWYPLWAFGFDGRIYQIDYVNDDSFVREIPAVFELVEQAARQYRWTADADYIDDSTLWSFYTAALHEFISAHDANRNTVADASGSGDIFLGVASYNENGERLIEAGDGIGSQYQALLAYAHMQRARGDSAGAEHTETRAADLKALFNTSWWSSEANRYIRGFTASGPKTDFGKENSWFMPMKRITEPGPRTDEYLDFIDRSVAALPPFNIEAYTYLPETFFPYGRDEQAWKWLAYLIDSRASYPEVAYTIVGQAVAGLLGVDPDVPAGRLATRAHLPGALEWLAIDHIPLGAHELRIRHDRAWRTTLTHTSGPGALVWQAQFTGAYAALQVDGADHRSAITTIDGRTTSTVAVNVQPGQTIVIELPGGAALAINDRRSAELRNHGTAEPPISGSAVQQFRSSAYASALHQA